MIFKLLVGAAAAKQLSPPLTRREPGTTAKPPTVERREPTELCPAATQLARTRRWRYLRSWHVWWTGRFSLVLTKAAVLHRDHFAAYRAPALAAVLLAAPCVGLVQTHALNHAKPARAASAWKRSAAKACVRKGGRGSRSPLSFGRGS